MSEFTGHFQQQLRVFSAQQRKQRLSEKEQAAPNGKTCRGKLTNEHAASSGRGRGRGWEAEPASADMRRGSHECDAPEVEFPKVELHLYYTGGLDARPQYVLVGGHVGATPDALHRLEEAESVPATTVRGGDGKGDGDGDGRRRTSRHDGGLADCEGVVVAPR